MKKVRTIISIETKKEIARQYYTTSKSMVELAGEYKIHRQTVAGIAREYRSEYEKKS